MVSLVLGPSSWLSWNVDDFNESFDNAIILNVSLILRLWVNYGTISCCVKKGRCHKEIFHIKWKIHLVVKNLCIMAHWWGLCESYLLRLCIMWLCTSTFSFSDLWVQIRFAKSRARALFWTPSRRRSCQKVRWDRFGIMIREVVWTTMCESGFPGTTPPAPLIDFSGMCCSLSVEKFSFIVINIKAPYIYSRFWTASQKGS